MNYQEIIDIFNSGSRPDVRFVCTAIIPNLNLKEVDELEKLMLEDGWINATFTDISGCFIKSQKLCRIRNMEEYLTRVTDSYYITGNIKDGY